MSTSMEQDDRFLRRGGDGRFHTFEIKTFGALREVGVVSHFETDVIDDLRMVGPGRGADVDGNGGGRGGEGGGVEFREEETSQVNSAGAGNCLDGCYAFVGYGWGIGT